MLQQGGSAVDFAVVSTAVKGNIQDIEAVFEVPWGPHTGIRVRLLRNQREVLTRVWKRHQRVDRIRECTDRGPGEDMEWETAMAMLTVMYGGEKCALEHVALGQQRKLATDLGFFG